VKNKISAALFSQERLKYPQKNPGSHIYLPAGDIFSLPKDHFPKNVCAQCLFRGFTGHRWAITIGLVPLAIIVVEMLFTGVLLR
jgi:hypothetical protein